MNVLTAPGIRAALKWGIVGAYWSSFKTTGAQSVVAIEGIEKVDELLHLAWLGGWDLLGQVGV